MGAKVFGLESKVVLLEQSQATQKMVIGEMRKEVAAKDAQIKALADALALVHREGLKGDMGGAFVKPLLTKEEFAQVTDALRLCGRLP